MLGKLYPEKQLYRIDHYLVRDTACPCCLSREGIELGAGCSACTGVPASARLLQRVLALPACISLHFLPLTGLCCLACVLCSVAGQGDGAEPVCDAFRQHVSLWEGGVFCSSSAAAAVAAQLSQPSACDQHAAGCVEQHLSVPLLDLPSQVPVAGVEPQLYQQRKEGARCLVECSRQHTSSSQLEGHAACSDAHAPTHPIDAGTVSSSTAPFTPTGANHIQGGLWHAGAGRLL